MVAVSMLQGSGLCSPTIEKRGEGGLDLRDQDLGDKVVTQMQKMRRNNPYGREASFEVVRQSSVVPVERQPSILHQKEEAEKKFNEIRKRIVEYLKGKQKEAIGVVAQSTQRELPEEERSFLEIVSTFEFLKQILFFVGDRENIITFMDVQWDAGDTFSKGIFEEIQENNFLISKICNYVSMSYRAIFGVYLRDYPEEAPLSFQVRSFKNNIAVIYHLFRIYGKIFSQNPEKKFQSQESLLKCYTLIVNMFNQKKILKYEDVQCEFNPLICCLLKFRIQYPNEEPLQYPDNAPKDLLQKVASIHRTVEVNMNQWSEEVVSYLVYLKMKSEKHSQQIPPYLELAGIIGRAFMYEAFEKVNSLEYVEKKKTTSEEEASKEKALEKLRFQLWGENCTFHCSFFGEKNFPILDKLIRAKDEWRSVDQRAIFIIEQGVDYLAGIRYLFREDYLKGVNDPFNSQRALEESTQLVENIITIFTNCIRFYELLMLHGVDSSNPRYLWIHEKSFIILKFLIASINYIEISNSREIYLFIFKKMEVIWDQYNNSQDCMDSLKEKIFQKIREHEEVLSQILETSAEKKEKMFDLLSVMIKKEEEARASPQRELAALPVRRKRRGAQLRKAIPEVEISPAKPLTLMQRFERKCAEIQSESWENKRRHLLEFWKTAKPQNGNEYAILHSKYVLQISQCYQLQIIEELAEFKQKTVLNWSKVLRQKDIIFYLYKELHVFLKRELAAHQQMILEKAHEIYKRHLRESNLDLQKNSQEIEEKYQDFCNRAELLALFQKMQESYTAQWDSLIHYFAQLQIDQYGILEHIKAHSDQLQENLKLYLIFKEEILKSDINQEQSVLESFQRMKDKIVEVQQAADNALKRSRQHRDRHCQAQKLQRAPGAQPLVKSEFTMAREQLKELSDSIERSLSSSSAASPFQEKKQLPFHVPDKELFRSLNDRYTIPRDIIDAIDSFAQRDQGEKEQMLRDFQRNQEQGRNALGDDAFDQICKYFSSTISQIHLQTLETK